MIAAALGALVVQYRAFTDGYVTDDAFISFRYAQNLADGIGPVWNPGERVEGYTNFALVLLLALGIKLGADPLDVSRAFGMLATAGTLALVPLLARELRPAWDARWWTIVAGGIGAVALNTATATWTFAGLETTGVMFFVTLGAFLHLREERRASALPAWSSIAFAAGALVRPDAVVAWAVTALFKARRLHDARQRRGQLRALAVWAAAFALPFGAYWLWRWNYYGDFYPNTYYLKTGEPFEVANRGWAYAVTFARLYSAWLLLPALLAAWREDTRGARPLLYMLALFGAWWAYVLYAGGDWMPYYRFFVPILPIFYVAAIHGAIDIADAALGARRRQVAVFAGVGAAALAAITAIAPHDADAAKHPPRSPSAILQGNVDIPRHRAIGLWMRANIPADYHIAQIATGIVPYYSRLPTIDMLGVNDRFIAHSDMPLGRVAPGHEKHDGGYVLSRKPEFIWLGLALEAVPFDSVEAYESPGFKLGGPLWTEVTENPYVWFLYRPVAVQIDEGWINLLVRRDVALPWLPAGNSRVDFRSASAR
jgi:hypothetical protein